MVAYKVKLDEDKSVDLRMLTLDQLRKLCKNVGVRYVNNCNKFQCRKALCVLAKYQEKMERDGAVGTTIIADKTTNNILCITNIIFSHDLLDSFLVLNDNKKG